MCWTRVRGRRRDNTQVTVDTHIPLNLSLYYIIFLSTRIAFAKNKIKDLPSNFATLTRLRYLNLRMNALSHFPPVVRTLLYFYI